MHASIDHYIRVHGRRLYGLCLHLCGSAHEADDLYQDTWLKATARFDRYDPSRDFEPWLTRICVNIYRNNLRRQSRTPLASFASTREHDAALEAAVAPEPDEHDFGPLHRALRQLPPKLRIAVTLHYFENMDVASTAAALGIPAGTVKSRLNKARTLLKEALDHEPDLHL